MVVIIVLVLCFATGFSVVTHWFGVATAVVLATLAACRISCSPVTATAGGSSAGAGWEWLDIRSRPAP